MSRLAWRALAVVCLGLGLVGLVLPLVPQIPFFLGAAAAAAKGWPWLDERLLAHPTVGPLIVGWRERHAIPFRAKAFCMLGLAMATVALFVIAAPTWLRIAWLVVAAIAAVWVGRRPVR